MSPILRSPRSQSRPSSEQAAHGAILLALFGGTLAGLQLAVTLPGTSQPTTGVLILYTAVFLLYVGAGLLAWWRRPGNRMGPLLIGGALAVFAGNLSNAVLPTVAVVGEIFATAVFAAIVHLLLAFPSGRLHGAAPAVVVVSGYAVAIVPQLPLLLMPGRPTASDALLMPQALGGLAVMVAAAVLLVRRVLAADPAFRRVLLPLYAYGLFAVLAVPASAALFRSLGSNLDLALAATQLVVLAGVPLAFVVGTLTGSFPRTGELIELSASLAAAGDQQMPLSDALSRTLGDDTLRLVFRTDTDEYVDERGDSVEPPAARAARALTPVVVAGRIVASIEYDPRLTAEGERIRQAGQIIAIAIDRSRLSAELLRSRRELVASRARLVDAADRERLRIAQDLHDGLQMQLVLLALEAQQIAHAAEAGVDTSARSGALRENIDAAASDLRRLVHDVLPLPLAGRGLGDAVEDLVDRMPVPTAFEASSLGDIPRATATTAYFVVAEALANAVKHARADRVTVILERDDAALRVSVADTGVGGAHLRGRGLGGLVDRVEALGGAIELTSVLGEGTTLRMEIPCAS